ncbi:MAG TPA: helix-turn-helix transcriptional regulator [Thermoanaerobaculia bacterium]|nr:helix-turn-helix transcriptional regulator [Thermoanaerobaculia bacterium]
MTGEIVSPWCVKLLRSAGEWSREDLAEATGAPVDVLAEYEEGRRPLPRESLEEMIAGLHLTEEDALSLGASIPRARPWRQHGPGLSDQEKSVIGRLTAQVGREVENELLARAATGRLGSDLLPGGVLPGISGIVRTVWGRYFLEMLIREGGEWEEVWHPRPEDRIEGAELWGRLERFPVRERNLLVDAAQEFAHWALCERICLQSADLAGEDARQAAGLAGLAIRIASRVPGEDSWRSRLKGFALAHLAHARSALGDSAGAAEAFREARQLWDEGAAGDPGLLDGSCLPFFAACPQEDEGALAE